MKKTIITAAVAAAVALPLLLGGQEGTITAPAAAHAAPTVHEEDPGFDCRIHGNHQCGVLYKGMWQVISYDETGNPVSVHPR